MALQSLPEKQPNLPHSLRLVILKKKRLEAFILVLTRELKITECAISVGKPHLRRQLSGRFVNSGLKARFFQLHPGTALALFSERSH